MKAFSVGDTLGKWTVIRLDYDTRVETNNGCSSSSPDAWITLKCVCGKTRKIWQTDRPNKAGDFDKDCGCGAGAGVNTGAGRPRKNVNERRMTLSVTLPVGLINRIDVAAGDGNVSVEVERLIEAGFKSEKGDQ